MITILKGLKIVWYTLIIIILGSCAEKPEEPHIAVNVLGYRADFPKQAFLVHSVADGFHVIESSTNQVVYRGASGRIKPPDPATGNQLVVLDFSDFHIPGNYFITAEGSGTYGSTPFTIGYDVYYDAVFTSLKSFYYHRCGTQVQSDGEWKYQLCHTDDAPLYNNPEIRIDVTGGWHDAGDYNKFSVNTALSAALLLYLYEHNQDRFTDNQLGIPESGNDIPDILDEVIYALEWLMKMQRADGAVYHKVSQKQWIGEFLPHEDPSVRYLFEISTTATASFTAVSALAARILEPHNEMLAEKLRESALRGWAYLESHPVIQPLGGFKNPPDVFGGEYGDDNDRDERMWAAIELYRKTGDEKYIQYFILHHQTLLWSFNPLSWRNVHSLALHAFLDADLNSEFNFEKTRVLEAWMNHADSIISVQFRKNYKNLVRHTEYYWGSNSVGLGYAFDLIQLYRHTGQLRYLYAAADQLHFVLGRNPVNRSQVTGTGNPSVQHPYHQLSEMGAFSAPVPGMLVGGPNSYVFLRNRKISDFPAKNYEDRFQNFYVNEPAINFTAIFSYVSGMIAFHPSLIV